jgi:hypothetical protein
MTIPQLSKASKHQCLLAFFVSLEQKNTSFAGGIKGFVMDDIKSLSHSKWRCKYHIIFAPK